MSYDVGAILQAMRTAALASDFGTTFGSRLFLGEAPPATALPYAVADVIDIVPFRDFDSDGGEMRVQVSMVGPDDAGMATVAEYATDLRANLSRAPLTVSGLDVLGVDYDISRGPFRDGDRWRVDADYIIRFVET